MAIWSTVLNGNIYDNDSFSGFNYANETTGLPAAMQDIVAHSKNVLRAGSSNSINLSTVVVDTPEAITTEVNKFFEVGQGVKLYSVSTPADYIFGLVASYTPSTGAISITPKTIVGTATYSNWTLTLGLAETQANVDQAVIGAQTAQGLSETARDASIVAKDASVAAQGLSETARDASIAAKDLSEAAYTDFVAIYRGPLASDPVTSLDTGDFYFNTTTDDWRVYDGAVWKTQTSGAYEPANANLVADNVANTFTATQTFKAIKETRIAMGANAIDLALGSIFTKTISVAATLTVSNIATTGLVSSFILELTNGGAFAVTWFAGVTWDAATAPTLTAAGRDLLGFITHDGGTTWSGIIIGQALA